ncbi:hypothetical protein IEQ34_021478 [Dendrobium chrysotoxum]|uniref:Uncharacterized protein n=1 Tax=Dendrobium chrysotoxum TaxID=161865 RepID=A0AAV7G3P1_DENCH|nr:hypothetical protein IEQ34_021478 [Dendrobium chrysotoxum]
MASSTTVRHRRSLSAAVGHCWDWEEMSFMMVRVREMLRNASRNCARKALLKNRFFTALVKGGYYNYNDSTLNKGVGITTHKVTVIKEMIGGSYLGVVARDPMLAPIAFPNWRNKDMEPFKKKMLAEVEVEHWDSRPIEKILETVPAGVDQMQWCQLVNQWSQPENQENFEIRLLSRTDCNYGKSIGCTKMVPGHLRTQACKLLAEEGLTPEDDNIEANERVFAIVMGPEHSGRVRTQGLVSHRLDYFPQSKSEEGGGSGSNFRQIASLREELRSFRDNQTREFGSFHDEIR